MKKIAVLAVLLFVALSAHAQSPAIISYQGLLTDSSGNPARDGSYSIQISLYTGSGTLLWRDSFESEVTSGVFNIALGSQTPLPAPRDLDQPLWAGVSVNGAPELVRTPLSAVPYAMNVADSSITTSKLADHSITWNKIGTEYVPYIRVNGAKINTGQSSINFTGTEGLKVDFDTNSMSVIIHSDSGYAGKNIGSGSHVLNTGDPWAIGGNDATTLVTDPSILGSISTSYGVDIYSGDHERILLPHSSGITMFPGSAGLTITGGSVTVGTFGARIIHSSSTGLLSSSPVDMSSSTEVKNVLGLVNGGTDTIPKWSATESAGNIATDNSSVVAGGSTNVADNIVATVGGGYFNNAFGDDAVISGGESNQVGTTAEDPYSFHSAVGGGANNTATGVGSDIPGGSSLKLGSFSFGFNGDADTATHSVRGNSVPKIASLTDLSATGANVVGVAYFGNVNVMVGNVDSVARAVQFYSPQTSHTYSGVHYSSLQAALQPQGNIIYTLPDSLPIAGEFLEAAAVTAPNVTLKWQTASGGGGPVGWLITGNAGTTPGPNYLGTQDNEAFEIHIHNNTLDTTGGNQRVMRYSEGPTSPDILGGSSFDSLTPGLSGAAILSGGSKVSPNIVSDSFSVVAGGRGNLIQGPLSAIAGGENNSITASGADHNFIGGGLGNTEDNPSFGVIAGGDSNYMGVDAYSSTIGGGEFDTVQASRSFIGGGHKNVINGGGSWSNFTVLVGGESNSLQSSHGFLGGGYGNLINAPISVLVGGDSNRVWADTSVIGGGFQNNIWGASKFSFLGGGANNGTQARYDALVGGRNNNIDSTEYAFLGGGQKNEIQRGGDHSVIVGGEQNTVGTNADHSTIGGGSNNFVNGPRGTIGGGIGNIIIANDTITDSLFVTDTVLAGSVISGGDTNIIRAPLSTIGGGSGNLIQMQSIGWCPCSAPASVGTIAGGIHDTIGYLDGRWGLGFLIGDDAYASPIMASIGGGWKNTVNGSYGTVGGGYKNHALGLGSAIPGGVGLEALDYQTAVGRYNSNPSYTAQLQHYYSPSADTLASIGDKITFMVGNGTSADSAHRSNAFEVSDDGHSIVHDVNGDTHPVGGINGRLPYFGGTYEDNTIIAWADVPSDFGLSNPHLPIRQFNPSHDFGVVTIFHPHPGEYVICVLAQNSAGDTIMLSQSSITATLEDQSMNIDDSTTTCGTITVSKIGVAPPPGASPKANCFIVRVTNSSCTPMDRPFFFKLCGRQ